MTKAGLVWSNLRRNKKRTILTMLSVTVAFFLFGVLRSVVTTLNAATEVGSEGRLIVSSASGITFLLPEAHAARLHSVEGVTGVSWANWFGAYYLEPNDFFAQFAIKADTYLPMYPEIVVTAGGLDAFMRERNAAIVGVGLIEKYGWQLGQKITLKGTTVIDGDPKKSNLAIPEGAGRTYFVNARGDDRNDGLTPETAKKTLQGTLAESAVVNGGTIDSCTFIGSTTVGIDDPTQIKFKTGNAQRARIYDDSSMSIGTANEGEEVAIFFQEIAHARGSRQKIPENCQLGTFNVMGAGKGITTL